MKTYARALAALSASLCVIASAVAAPYPDKPVQIIVPYPPGGTTDILGRLVAAHLTESLKQTFVVENRPGANGAIGSVAVAKARPDGYTLLMGTLSTHGINSALYKNLPYDAVTDFSPVTIVASTPNVIVVNPEVPAKNLAELKAYAASQKSKLDYGSTSQGGSPHMSAELLKLMSGMDMVHVPYKGAGPMLTDLIGGHIKVGFDNLPSTMGFIRAGTLRPIAITTAKRWPGAPDIPTVAESGLEGYEVSGWFGLLAPAGTPEPVLKVLQQAVANMVAKPEVREQMLNLGAEPVANTPAEFTAQVGREVTKWRDVVDKAGIKVE